MNKEKIEIVLNPKIAIGLVVRGGKEFINEWIESAERSGDVILVVDNDADDEVREKLINHPKVVQYHKQHFKNRNMSRDYQKILDMAREEKCQWVWLLDHDKYVPEFNLNSFRTYLLNTFDKSIGFPLFEMRNDEDHYVMLPKKGENDKHARMSHEMYKVQSHFAYDIQDEHSGVIPQNCTPSEQNVNVMIKHFGHMTKKLREEKRQKYINDKEKFGYDDKGELKAIWMEEDESKLDIREFKDMEKLFAQ